MSENHDPVIDASSAQTDPAGEELDPVFLLADTDPEAMKAMNAEVVAGFRASQGRLESFEGVPLLLLTTTGRRTGRPFTTPVNYTRAGEAYVVIASKSGAPRHPDWYHNLLASPLATVEVDGPARRVRARVADGVEREQLFAHHREVLPNFAAYEKRTTRVLPVVVLEPAG